MSFIKNESFGYDNSDAATMSRKFAKTCVEKKRRDRINRCLDELKDLMSQADDKAKYQKMEKAEILEMAVTYMKSLLNNNNSSCTVTHANQSEFQNNYTQAYRQCLNEFQTCLQSLPGVQDDFKSGIMYQMSRRYTEMLTESTNTVSVNGSQKRKMSQYKHRRYAPYSQQTPEKKPCNDQGSFSYNFSGSCSSLDSFQNNVTDVHNESVSLSCSGSSSPSLSQCSSPLSCSNKMNLSSEENVWRPW